MKRRTKEKNAGLNQNHDIYAENKITELGKTNHNSRNTRIQDIFNQHKDKPQQQLQSSCDHTSISTQYTIALKSPSSDTIP